jgi:dolichyl-phosphate beta-glucosyltransferase
MGGVSPNGTWQAWLTMGAPAIMVVPCYDEATRLRDASIDELLDGSTAELLFVDDGSNDATPERLAAVERRHPDRVQIERLPSNRGKGEAVRHGLLLALDRGAPIVGYCDADFATPPSEVARLIATVDERDVDAVLGSRVALLGTNVHRSTLRHYLGRVFATAASLAIGLTVYDTQCGAKAFRDTPELRAALERPFAARWAFDVELLARLHRGDGRVDGLPADRLLELPLHTWRDMPGSKLTAGAAARAALDLVFIARSSAGAGRINPLAAGRRGLHTAQRPAGLQRRGVR